MVDVKKNALFYIYSGLIKKGLVLISSLVLIRLLDIDFYGAYFHIKLLAVFLTPLTLLGMENTFFRIKNLNTNRLIILYISIIFFALAIVLTLFFTIIPDLYLGKVIIEKYSISKYLIFSSTLFFLIQAFADSFLIAYEKAKIQSYLTIILSLSVLFSELSLFIYKNINLTLGLISILYLISFIVGTFLGRSIIIKEITESLKDFKNKELRKKSWHDLKNEFLFFRFYTLQNISDVIIKRLASIYFANMGDLSIVAILNLFNQFVDMAQTIALSVNNAWGVNRLKCMLDDYRKDKNSLKVNLSFFYKELESISFVLASIFILASPIWSIIFLYMTSRWNLPSSILVLMVAIVFIRYIFDFLGNISQYNFLFIEERIKQKIIFSIIINCILIPFNYFAMKYYSVEGAILFSVLPSLLLFIFGEFLLSKFRKERIKLLVHALLILVPISFCVLTNRYLYAASLGVIISLSTIFIYITVYRNDFLNHFSLLRLKK